MQWVPLAVSVQSFRASFHHTDGEKEKHRIHAVHRPTDSHLPLHVAVLCLHLASLHSTCLLCTSSTEHLLEAHVLQSMENMCLNAQLPMCLSIKLDQGPRGYLPRSTLIGEAVEGQQPCLSGHPQHCLEVRDESALSNLKPWCYHKPILHFKYSPNQPFIKCFPALNSLFNVLVTTSK